jgi:hypothetical protein
MRLGVLRGRLDLTLFLGLSSPLSLFTLSLSQAERTESVFVQMRFQLLFESVSAESVELWPNGFKIEFLL